MRLCRLLWVLALLLVSMPALAEQPAAGGSLEAEVVDVDLPPPGPPPPADQVDEITLQVASTLRCPVCQGSAVSDSPSDAAIAMRGRIRELVAQGYTGDQIQDYFAARYGEWVLLQPRATGLNWLVWVGPGVGAVVAVVWVTVVARRWRQEPEASQVTSEMSLDPRDSYEARLLQEMEE